VLDDPVSVAQFMAAGGGVAQAEGTRAALECAGIAAFTAGHALGETTGWVRVFVTARDFKRAEALIAEIEEARRQREAFEHKTGKSIVRCLSCDRPMTAERCRHCGWSWLDGAEEELREL
jgi:hypothetical protein